ncbi:MAG: nucleotidyltransferase, partial [Cyclobacteriaceae bacterium]
VIGPYVSIGDNSSVKNSLISESIIQKDTTINHVHLKNSMIGNHVSLEGTPRDMSLGDFNTVKS